MGWLTSVCLLLAITSSSLPKGRQGRALAPSWHPVALARQRLTEPAAEVPPIEDLPPHLALVHRALCRAESPADTADTAADGDATSATLSPDPAAVPPPAPFTRLLGVDASKAQADKVWRDVKVEVVAPLGPEPVPPSARGSTPGGSGGRRCRACQPPPEGDAIRTTTLGRRSCAGGAVNVAATGPGGGQTMPGVDTLYLIHHSHTDVGYTHDQPVVWDLYRRFLDQAVDLAVADADHAGDDAFRWTVETTAPLLRWLESAPPARRRLFVDLCRLGRIEVTAMPVNVTPLYDTAELAEALEPVEHLRRQGIPVRSAMNSDVNGENWPLADLLLDAGIGGFSMAINLDHGGAPPDRPRPFLWEGASGRRLLAWAGWSYGLAWGIGVGHSADALAKHWPEVAVHLEAVRYPLPGVMMQLYSGFGDNAPPIRGLSEFVRRWNASGQTPRLVVSTPTEWWAFVARHQDRLPVWRGDWTDYWNFGAGSSSIETAINRESRGRLETADRAMAALSGLGLPQEPERMPARDVRRRCVFAMQLWDEHTWGADCSCSRPDDEDTLAQWNHKAHYAYEARSASLMLRRDAVAELARRVQHGPDDAVVIWNPLAEDRIVAGPVADPRHERQRGGAAEPTAARHWLDRAEHLGAQPWGYLPPTTVPAFGYTVVPTSVLRPRPEHPEVSDAEQVTCGRYRITFDRGRGGIRSLYDTHLGRELVDGKAPHPLHGFVHERLAPGTDGGRFAICAPQKWAGTGGLRGTRGWIPDWPAERRTPDRVVEHRVERTPIGVRVVQRLQAPGVQDLVQTVTLVHGLDDIGFESRWHAPDVTTPEATYLVFPFALTDAAVRFDAGHQTVRPEADQIPGVCRDYYTVQRWVDIAGGEGGATLACPDTPLWQFGDFSFGANRDRFELRQPWLLAWVTNNYWHTNFRASQPGPIRARFVLRPYAGAFDASRAHRFGAESALPPVFQHTGEPVVGTPLPREGSLLRLPEVPVQVLTCRWDTDGSVLLRLHNETDTDVATRVAPGLLGIDRAAATDILGAVGGVLPVGSDGAVALTVPAGRMTALRLWLTRA